MKFTKLAAGAVLALASAAFATAEGATFTNTVSTDLYYFNEAKTNDADRVGDLKDEFEAKYESEMFDLGLKAIITLDNNGQEETVLTDAQHWTGFNYNLVLNEWFIRYRPFSLLQVRLNDYEWIKGATLFSWDETHPRFAQTIGSGALDFDFFPMEGLKLSVGLWDGQTILDSRKGNDPLAVTLSAAYEIEGIGTVSLTTDDLFDENNRSLGLYGNITAVENLELNAGLVFDLADHNGMVLFTAPDFFTSTDDFTVDGKTLILAGAKYTGVENLTLAADIALGLGAEKTYGETADLFFGAKVSYDISEALTAGIRFGLLADVIDTNDYADDANVPVFSVNPEASYKMGNHTFKAGIAFSTYTVGDTTQSALYFPLSWKYEF